MRNVLFLNSELTSWCASYLTSGVSKRRETAKFRVNYFVKVLAALESHRWLYFEYSKLLRYVFIDLKKCPVHGEICQENAECNDTSETYQCLCKPGYEQDYDRKCMKGWYVIR